MAKRSTKRRGGYRKNPYNAKHYQFTSRRRAALKRAQAVSARKRKMTALKVGIVAVGAVGVAAYLGRNTSAGKSARSSVASSVRNFSPQMARARNAMAARIAVQPHVKEAVRMDGAVSPADTPAQPGHVGVTPAPYPHTPGSFVEGDLSTYKKTTLGKEDPGEKRDELQKEAEYAASAEGSLAKFTDTSGRGNVQRLIKGKQITTDSYRKALEKHNAEVIKSGGTGMTKLDMDTHISDMLGSGKLRESVAGKRTAPRTNPKAVPKKVVPNTGFTEAEHAAMQGTTPAPYQPSGVQTIPSTVAGARSVVTNVKRTKGHTLAPGDYEAVVAGLMGANKGMTRTEAEGHIFGQLANKARAAGVTPLDVAQQTGAVRGGGDAKPSNVRPLFQEPKPHAPSARPTGWDDVIGQRHPNWDTFSTADKRSLKASAKRRGFYVNFKTGMVDKLP